MIPLGSVLLSLMSDFVSADEISTRFDSFRRRGYGGEEIREDCGFNKVASGEMMDPDEISG